MSDMLIIENFRKHRKYKGEKCKIIYNLNAQKYY